MIDIYVLNTEFQVVGVIDTYESFIWTDRFTSYGDFELYTAFDYSLIELCKQNYYLHINESEHTMIIEGIEIETNPEEGNKLRITGRSLESILDRRIIWSQTTIGGKKTGGKNLQQAIEYLLNLCIINPTQPTTQAQKAKRKISNFKFIETEDPYITSLEIEKTQYTGDNLYDVIVDLLEDQNNTVGFQILLNANNEFEFQLYTGVDHSYAQNERPYVVFSPQFDNIINTDYLDSTEGMKNVTLVHGEGEGTSRIAVIVGSESGLNRRELYTDARDLKSEDYNNMTQYKKALKNRGYNKLVENSRITSYEGEVEATRQYVFGVDFEMGDVVQMSNEYGIEGNVRIIEWVISESSEGREVYPTFDAVQLIDDTTVDDDIS